MSSRLHIPHPSHALEPPSIFPPPSCHKACGGGEGIKSRLASTPLRSRDFITRLPSCLQPSIGPGPGDLRSMDSMLFTGFCPEQAARGEGAWTQRPEPSLKALLLGQKRNGCECLRGEGGAMVAALA